MIELSTRFVDLPQRNDNEIQSFNEIHHPFILRDWYNYYYEWKIENLESCNSMWRKKSMENHKKCLCKSLDFHWNINFLEGKKTWLQKRIIYFTTNSEEYDNESLKISAKMSKKSRIFRKRKAKFPPEKWIFLKQIWIL